MVIEVTKENFEEEVLKSEKPVMVDFWGPQCGPCKALMPEIEKIAEEFAGRAKVAKIDASKNRRLCIELKVLSLPAVLFFKNGAEVARGGGSNVRPETIRWTLNHLLGETGR